MSAPVDALLERGPELGRRVLDRLLENPFWKARYGERAERFGKEDNGYHLDYLAESVRADDVEVMKRYARWLQSVLNSRGMCTRHLDENFALMIEELTAMGLANPEVTAHLEAARAALRYDPGAARAIQDAAPALVEAISEELYRRHPEWSSHDERQRGHCRNDVGYQLDYLADAVAMNRPELYVRFVTWTAGFMASRGFGPRHLHQSIALVGEAVPSDAKQEAQRCITPALIALKTMSEQTGGA